MDKYQALKHNDGRMLAVQWPDISQPYSGNYDYQLACEQAIANGIPFKDQEDINYIKWEIWNSITPDPKTKSFKDGFYKWDMEKMKPYPLPSGIELEIKYFYRTNHWTEIPKEIFDSYSSEDRKRKYAFIKKEIFKPAIIGVGMDDDKEESQDELWEELYDMYLHSRNWKSKFRISRIR